MAMVDEGINIDLGSGIAAAQGVWRRPREQSLHAVEATALAA
jgi:hypothetical protein